MRVPRDFASAVGTAGSPTHLQSGKGSYRWSETFPCLYSTNFETALIRIRTDSGLTGWGEAQAPLAPEVACTIVRLLLAPVLEGGDFEGSREEIEKFWDLMYATMRVRGQTGGFMLDAISGVDLALWDLAGKMAGKPVSQLLSATPHAAVPAYVSGLSRDNRSEQARRFQDEGFRTFKLFYDCGEAEFFRGLDEMPEGARIAVDALWRLTLETALTFGAELDDRDAVWLEAPLLPEDAVAHGALARQIGTPVALGESYRTRHEIGPFVKEGAVGVFQPDLGRCGITEGTRMAALARTRGAWSAPHISIACGPQLAAALHYAAATEGCLIAEFNPLVLAFTNRFVREPLRLDSARWLVPAGPGLGIEMDEDALERAGA